MHKELRRRYSSQLPKKQFICIFAYFRSFILTAVITVIILFPDTLFLHGIIDKYAQHYHCRRYPSHYPRITPVHQVNRQQLIRKPPSRQKQEIYTYRHNKRVQFAEIDKHHYTRREPHYSINVSQNQNSLYYCRKNSLSAFSLLFLFPFPASFFPSRKVY